MTDILCISTVDEQVKAEGFRGQARAREVARRIQNWIEAIADEAEPTPEPQPR